ncbi:S8 family serine peptidase [uncultured Parabacteroides sp.]|uniref:S8 family serine peptidase n=1 Tax=uncultured Parabacteroides sp. TaxID=512312 RepID=UPI0028054BE9|nr:S8 family serine peptidase [uncultured Parabacteroides sp.]
MVASGRNILSTLPNNQTGYGSGTSFAAPHVTGVTALVLSANPSLSAQEVRRINVPSNATVTWTCSGGVSLSGSNTRTSCFVKGTTPGYAHITVSASLSGMPPLSEAAVPLKARRQALPEITGRYPKAAITWSAASSHNAPT